ncbi:hypothetical protein [uncultured Sphingomonas sp.]|uniref:hypothetical protein n=1 Tax=uncultured Sphingomonas sp. TaxID=158754 RepID=UPI0025F970B3|nr:hypothetical protein [uncultured Sphingomonas sp.]
MTDQQGKRGEGQVAERMAGEEVAKRGPAIPAKPHAGCRGKQRGEQRGGHPDGSHEAEEPGKRAHRLLGVGHPLEQPAALTASSMLAPAKGNAAAQPRPRKPVTSKPQPPQTSTGSCHRCTGVRSSAAIRIAPDPHRNATPPSKRVRLTATAAVSV